MRKAWEMEHELMQNAIPVVLEEEDQTWEEGAEFAGDYEVAKLKLQWKSNVPGSYAPERIIIGAIQSMENMGYYVEEAEKLIPQGLKALEEEDIISLNKVSAKIYHILNEAKKDLSADYWQYKQYEDWEDYKRSVSFVNYPKLDFDGESFQEKILAGWLAQICGGALGTAIEGYTTDNIEKTFGEIWGYVRKPNTYNDDITFELAFLKAFYEKGYAITSEDIAEEWVGMIPMGWSAEDIALKNIRSGVYPPLSGKFNNYYREWIGAQMRGAICGMVAPGNPEEAARLAWLDAVISHHNNGVIGEIFNATLVSLAFVEEDVRILLEKTIEMLPKDSEYYAVIDFAYTQCKKHHHWKDAWRPCEEKFKKYNWIHAYPNAAAEVIALYFGGNDFDETMHIISMAGQDVDCNAAQIATIYGILHGLKGIDKRWVEPIGDDLNTYVRGMEKLKISEVAALTIVAIKKAEKGE
ncbi:ADP-ribosylglycohydrolase [Anaerovirgula multivorans]|uniref:ADP-ribosylglycohydrolase n=1 Tax=Anaerovirgula multivorans TaxID=312168 RepID=A0A239FDB5_9FIRM|nr:ADP-ribosylglycohydrolase family protein [Anaerovirgula multivorans]SNS54064.1 ADP-ribosylglycohydrolase [Anaerovirgula multivorans]